MSDSLSDCRIRPATGGDLDDMTGLVDTLFGIEPDFTFDPAKARRGLELLLSRPDAAAVWVADVHGKVVAMCGAQIVISTAQGGPVAWVEDVVVSPAHRGNGIGRRLLDAVAAWANQRGLTRLQLLVDRHNRDARDFYERIGWRETRMICLRRFGGTT